MERNRVEFIGTIKRLRDVSTKTGIARAKFFGNLAATVLTAGEGHEIGVVGRFQYSRGPF